IVDACRSVRTLTRMSVQEANKAQIDPIYRHLHFRVEYGKRNYAPPEAAKWLKFETVTLANGDRAGVLVPWEFPDVAAETSNADAEWARGEVLQRDFRKDARAADWFGNALAERLKLNVHNPKDKKRVTDIIQRWLETGVLTTERREDHHRKPREYLVPGSAPVAPVN